MARQKPGVKTPFGRLLFGERWSMTKRALLLSVGFFSAIGAATTVALTFTPPVGETGLGTVWYETMSYAFRSTNVHPSVDPVGLGAFWIAGLALIHAYLNAGYVPSLILATAPMYAFYVFTVGGPTGLVLPVHADLVIAPVWAARHVFPNSFAYGTLGFLLGLGLRYIRRRYAAKSDRDVVRAA